MSAPDELRRLGASPAAAPAPLSYGQLSVLRHIQDDSRDQWSRFTIGRYCRLADDPDPAGRTRPGHVRATSGRPAVATFYVMASYDLAIGAHVDRALFPDDRVRRFLHGVEAWLRAAYADPDATISALRDAVVSFGQVTSGP